MHILLQAGCVFLASAFLLAARAAPSAANLAESAKTTPLPLPSASARQLFSRYKERLVQVRVLLNTASEQSALGSGFVVQNEKGKGALVMTNYHVVSSLAIHPEKYRIELRPTSERSVKAVLIAVDVIHDLALMRVVEAEADAPTWPAFSLRTDALAQGEKVFALGNPLELGFLISEGIYNGPVESRIYEQMLFSGALNSGMSGGPAIDEAGRVVGINVATHSKGSLLSFLVPVEFASTLLARAKDAAPRKEWRTEIGKQLLAHQQFVTEKLLASAPATVASATTPAPVSAGFATQTLVTRKVQTLDGALTKCWAGGRDGERLRYQSDTLQCSLSSGVYVRGNLSTGMVKLSHRLLRNDTLAMPQFLALESGGGGASFAYTSDYSVEKSRSECRDDYVSGSAKTYRVSICLTGYRKFEGLYDFSLHATQIDDVRERLTSELSLAGFSFDNGQRISRLFLDRLQ